MALSDGIADAGRLLCVSVGSKKCGRRREYGAISITQMSISFRAVRLSFCMIFVTPATWLTILTEIAVLVSENVFTGECIMPDLFFGLNSLYGMSE